MADKYGFLITIDSTDNRADVVKTIKGNNSILDLIEGRDPETDGIETWFNRYVLKPSLVGGQELSCEGWVGINSNVPAVVRNEYSQNTVFWRTIDFGGGVFTRVFMQQRIMQEAKFNGCTRAWVIIPGNALTGDLLSHFVIIS